MREFVMWLLFKGRRCPWGCGDWVTDGRLAVHYAVEHVGD